MATGATSEHLLGEVMLHEPVMQQSYLLEEFDQSYQPIATIQPGAPIEFLVKNSEKLYLDLNDSKLRVKLRILKKDKTALAANAPNTSPVNLMLHSLFQEMTIQLNGKTVTDPSNLYPYRAYMETLLNYGKEVQKFKLLTEGWVIDTSAHMDEATANHNKGLVERQKLAAESREIELTGRPHLDLFQQDKLIPPGIDMTVKLIPSSDKFVLMCGDANFEPWVEIKEVNLIVHKKQLTSAAELAHRQLVQEQNFRIPFTRVSMKHMAIPANSQSISLDNLFSGPLPDLVVMGFVADDAHAGSYTRNPFNFQNFRLKRIELLRNGTKVPRYGYTPAFATNNYNKDYLSFQAQLGFANGERCVNLTPEQWSNGFTLYAFKLTDGPIGSGTVGPRSHSSTGSVRVEFEFEVAPTANLKLIVMSQTLGILEVDQFNNIVVS